MSQQRKTLQARVVKGDAPRTFRFTLSTGEPDREHDRIDPAGWNLTNYLKNPVVLDQHKTDDLPVAKAIEAAVSGVVPSVPFSGALRATAQFPPIGISPRADQIFSLLTEGYLAACSVGFLPTVEPTRNEYGGLDFHGQELLEFSIVSVHALPSAIVDRRSVRAAVDAVRKWLQAGPPHCRWPITIRQDDPVVVVTTDAAQAPRSNVRESLRACGIPDAEAFLRKLAGRAEPGVITVSGRPPERIVLPVSAHELAGVISEVLGAEVRRALSAAMGNPDFMPPGGHRR